MTFPKFEDWTPPWGSDDDNFDAEKAKKRVYDLMKDKSSQAERIAALTTEKDDLQTKVTAFEEKDMSALEKAQAEIERLKKAPATKVDDASGGENLETERLRLALKHGLTEAQAKRLVGSTAEELAADAEAYIEEHGLAGASGGDEGGKNNGGSGGQAPPSNRAKVKTGTKQGQQEIDPYEGLTPDELYDKVYVRT